MPRVRTLFSHLFPIVLTLTFNDRRGQPVLGCILAPCLGGLAPNASMTLFSGIKGGGSYLTLVDPNKACPSFSWPPTAESTKLPYVSPPAPFPSQAPKGCLFACEWGKQRHDDEDGKLSRKVRSFWNMACQYGSRQGKGGESSCLIGVSIHSFLRYNRHGSWHTKSWKCCFRCCLRSNRSY